MAASNGDVVRVTVNQRQDGEVVQNIYHYQVVTLTGLGGDYLEIVRDWMINEVLAAVRGIQTASLKYENLFIQNVTNGIDFIDHTFVDVTGTQGAVETLPSFVTLTFRLLRETLATRHGYKRYAGIPEAWTSGNTFVGLGSSIDLVRTKLYADIQPAPSVVPLLAPVIVRKDATGAITAINNVGGADFRGIGSQNTRKAGRGS